MSWLATARQSGGTDAHGIRRRVLRTDWRPFFQIGVDDPRRSSGRSYIYVQGINLSDYGVAIRSPHALQKNASLWLRLADGCATRCWVPARVVHAKKGAAGYTVGLEFLFNRAEAV
jgi:hypothetical protein